MNENYTKVATVNSNPNYISKSEPFYYGNQMKSWANVPMSYAQDIAIENYFSQVLELPLDRIIYASNEYCFRERTRKNKGELNLPFFNYYRKGFEPTDRPWFNNYANKFGMLDTYNKFTSALGGKIKLYPITMNYEGTVFYAQDKDNLYAVNKLLYESSNETKIYPQIETNDGTIIKNIGIVDFNIDYMPNYQESDWLEQNRIWSIGVDFSVQTFMIGEFDGNPNNLHVAKKVVLEFFTAKKFDYSDYNNSEQLQWVLKEYFDGTSYIDLPLDN